MKGHAAKDLIFLVWLPYTNPMHSTHLSIHILHLFETPFIATKIS